jgi:hypothetical protein
MIEGGGLFSWLLPCVLVSWIDGLIVGGGCFRMAMCGVLLQRISSPVWVRLSPQMFGPLLVHHMSCWFWLVGLGFLAGSGWFMCACQAGSVAGSLWDN